MPCNLVQSNLWAKEDHWGHTVALPLEIAIICQYYHDLRESFDWVVKLQTMHDFMETWSTTMDCIINVHICTKLTTHFSSIKYTMYVQM